MLSTEDNIPYESIINVIDYGLIVFDMDGKIIQSNKTAEALIDRSFSTRDDSPNTQLFFKKHEIDHTKFPFQKYVVSSDETGQPFYIELKGEVLNGSSNQATQYVLLLKDVTSEAKKLTHGLDSLDKHQDSLTGALSRSHFIKQLKELLDHASKTDHKQSHALLYVDVDQLKIINDSYGHTAGDQLLNTVANRIPTYIRYTDIFGRLGGDEFGIILVNCNPVAAIKAANNINQAISKETYKIDNMDKQITASIGLLIVDEQYTEVSDVMRDAEIACTLAKKEGYNRVHRYLNSEKDVTAYKLNVNWVDRIHHALKHEQFELYFQAIHAFEPNVTMQGEILIRLVDDNGDIISPGEFMPCVEYFYLSTALDKYVIDKAFEFLETNLEATSHISKLGINLSGQSVNDIVFRKYLFNKVSTAKFPLEKVTFEITESVALEHLEEVIPFIQTLKKMGVKIALDDFGNGASSFTYLRQLPVDYLKIDGQLIVNLHTEAFSQLTVDCLTKIAALSNAKTVAEWVESKEVYDAVEKSGVDYVQGFYHHKPEPLKDFFNNFINTQNEKMLDARVN